MAAERLQKIIAAAGITSRRKAEELITQGRVTVNGQVIKELGSKADPEQDHIKVDGKLLRGAERHIYLLLNKPKGYVTTVADPEGRPTVMDLVKHVGERIYPIGRLDYASEGLLLMTNDGELANFLTRAASHVPKTYLVKIAGQASEEDIDKLRHGIRIGSKQGMRGMQAVRTAPAQVNIVREGDNPWYEVTLIEGKNRQIRRMFEEIGHHVEKIKRVRYGSLKLDVEPGNFRELAPHEVAALRKAKPGRDQDARPGSAAKGAARFIGKRRVTGRDQDRFHPRKEGARNAKQQGEQAKPKFDRRAKPDTPNREHFRPRKEGARNANEQDEQARPKFDRRAKPERPKFGQRLNGERPKFAPRGERHASGQEKRREGHQQQFDRGSRRPRKFNRDDRRSEARSPKSRFKH